MALLHRYRKSIDYLDQKMVSILVQRFQLVLKTSEIKVKQKSPLRDLKREAEVLKNIRRLLLNVDVNLQYEILKIFRDLLKASVRIQRQRKK